MYVCIYIYRHIYIEPKTDTNRFHEQNRGQLKGFGQCDSFAGTWDNKMELLVPATYALQ